ncbi:MAG: phospho-N-acetylmuramoyl-pentapeptide-transferase [Planctomycetaceae bacterium]|nr:phospho-N-acetylmuramoyl-pentapeptide-transferase [Planctomycetaceae bacterium]
MLTARIALAAVASFVAVLILGPWVIRLLAIWFRERVGSASKTLDELHAGKQNTPTMGGLFIAAAVLVATLLFGRLGNPYVQLGLFAIVAFTILGALDDSIKLFTSRLGLTAKEKFLSQCALGLICTSWLYVIQQQTHYSGKIVWLDGAHQITVGKWIILWGVFVIVGTSNGVNLTDGLDGLAAGCMLTAGAAVTTLVYLSGHAKFAEFLGVPRIAEIGELCVVLGAVLGALLGFLWFNCHPAQVFMGDTGALPLGAILAIAGLAVRQELLLVIVGGVFVVETVSVILQIGSFRLTKRRILRCSPLHNHYVFQGVPETRIVTRFWIVSAILGIAGLALIKLL